ncbi:SDR family oxidoreductase [Rhodococcus pseudokoreensis]|uniref:SDR family oxidoreductase n=1 Tax=Rhodococcus pseudokoreensis TaxID=2811421 RepID=UPI001F124C96|nr:SDR family NAD(P)-dependent oxidoreductase [Rhodococcus pseudokoreensis]
MVLVIGAGPGVSGSVAKRFAREGYKAALVGLDEQVLVDLAADLESSSVGYAAVDVTDEDSLSAAVKHLGDRVGRFDVLHFNPSSYRAKNALALTAEELAQDISLGVGALLTALHAARPYMSAGGRITATGSMVADVPNAMAASLGVQKAALRNLVHSIDSTLKDDGIRAVSVTVRGILAKDGAFTPDHVAQAIYTAATQDTTAWRTEVPYSGLP